MNDVNNLANNMITQMVCAEKGIDFNQVVEMAQNQLVNNILEQERQRQINALINNHYQGGNSFIGRLKNAFGAPNYSLVGGHTPMMPMQQFAPPVQNNQQDLMNALSALVAQANNKNSNDNNNSDVNNSNETDIMDIISKTFKQQDITNP